jgi:hypothetical protein
MSTLEKSGWQPIETAPKDRKILACWHVPATKLEGHYDEPARWDYATVEWWDSRGSWQDGSDFPPDPTHWMPLPEPPA